MGTIGSIIGVFGKQQARGDYPMYQPLDLTKTLSKTTEANLAQIPKLEQIAQEVNTFSQAELDKRLKASGVGTMLTGTKNVISEMLRGELPEGVKQQLLDQAAAYGVASGTSGSQFAGFRGLRQLGLNSLQYMQSGVNSAEQWVRTAAAIAQAPLMNLGLGFISQTAGLAFQEEEARRQQESLLGKWSLGNFLTDASTSLMETGAMWGGGSTGGAQPMSSWFGGGNQGWDGGQSTESWAGSQGLMGPGSPG